MAKIPTKAATKAAEALVEEGVKAAAKGKTALAELLEKVDKAPAQVRNAFDELVQGAYKPKAPKPAASMPAPARKPAPPPSEPRPALQQEPAPTAKPAPKAQPQTKPTPTVPRKVKKKLKDKESDEPGVVKISDVFETVNRVMAEDHPWIEFSLDLLGPIGLHTKTVKDEKLLAVPDVPRDAQGQIRIENDDDKAQLIKTVVKAKRLNWKAPRSREKLKTPGLYPGTDSKFGKPYKKYDIMRRGDGANARRKRITLVGPYGGIFELVANDWDKSIAQAKAKADKAWEKKWGPALKAEAGFNV